MHISVVHNFSKGDMYVKSYASRTMTYDFIMIAWCETNIVL